MKIYGQLERAALEVLSSDPAVGVTGRIYFNSTEKRVKTDNGTVLVGLLANDDKLVIGTSVTAADNTRIHRGAAGLLQFVAGSDSTTEGSKSSSINQLSFRAENVVNASKPAAGQAGRLAWVSDKSSLQVDNGATWIPVGSGGGGGSLVWVEDLDSPVPAIDQNTRVYQFSALASQQLFTLVRVPNSYVTGSQVRARLVFYSADSSGNVLMQAQSTLIRVGTDAFSSITNQLTSPNTAVTMSGGNANVPQALVLDLTDSSGQINGVAVAPGDLIKLRLLRGTDTATGVVNVPVFGTEISFS